MGVVVSSDMPPGLQFAALFEFTHAKEFVVLDLALEYFKGLTELSNWLGCCRLARSMLDLHDEFYVSLHHVAKKHRKHLPLRALGKFHVCPDCGNPDCDGSTFLHVQVVGPK